MLCFFKQKTAYELRIIDWSSDVCSSDRPALPDRGSGADDLGGPGVDRKAVPRLSHAGAVYLSGGQRLACEWRRDDDDIAVLLRVYPACRQPISQHVVVASTTLDHGKPKPCKGTSADNPRTRHPRRPGPCQTAP